MISVKSDCVPVFTNIGKILDMSLGLKYFDQARNKDRGAVRRFTDVSYL